MPTWVEVQGFRLLKEDHVNVEAGRQFINRIRAQKLMPAYDFQDWLKVLMKSGYEAFREACQEFKSPGEPAGDRLVLTPAEFREQVLGRHPTQPGVPLRIVGGRRAG